MIPSIVEEVMQFVKCDADFILHVEKDTVWRRFNEDKFWKEHNCILTHGNGQPPRGVRRLLSRMHNELDYQFTVCLIMTLGDITQCDQARLHQSGIRISANGDPGAKFIDAKP